jgi:putative MATE family efflux protein
MSSIRKVDLTQGSIRQHLVNMTVPMTWGILAIISFQLVNTYWISKLGTADLAAISYTHPVTFAIFSVFLGFGIAMSSVVSRLLGSGQYDDVKRVVSHGLILVFITSLIVAAIGHTFMHPIFRAMGASDDMIARIDDYMTLYWWGTFFICMPIVANSSLRAGGETMIPAIVMTVAAVANVLIDPILIFGLFGFPRLELQGAAISNILANACAMIVCLAIMFKRQMISVSYLKNLSQFSDSAKRILTIALPAGITSMLPSIYNAAVISVLAMSGAHAVAAYGVVNRVEAFAFVILIGLASGMTPILGQNFGAKNMVRVRDTMSDVLFFSLLWSAFMGVALVIFSQEIAQAFSSEIDVQKIIILYFTVIAFCFPFAFVTNGWSSAFNSLGKPQYAVSILFTKTILVMIPAAILGHIIGGIVGTFWAIAMAHTITGIATHIISVRILKRL